MKDYDIIVVGSGCGMIIVDEAALERDGFAKATVGKDTGRIFGFHIIGPQAPALIQEVISAMAAGGNASQVFGGMRIHPAMPDLIPRTLHNLHE